MISIDHSWRPDAVDGSSLIRRVYEVDPLLCPRCRSLKRVVSFITEPALVRRILDDLAHGLGPGDSS